MTWMASSVRRPRSLNGTPDGVELARQLDADADRREEAAAREPVERGHLLGRHHRRPVREHDDARPELERVVRAATAASVVMTSGTGIGEDRRSESQSESISLRSQEVA